MQIEIKNFRGLAAASVAAEPMALIAGPNGAGKTSLCQAVAAGLTGSTIPLAGLRKQDAGALVRTGSAGGQVEISGDDGSTSINWPGLQVASDGTPPWASRYAAGLATIVDLPRQQRMQAMSPYLGAEPTRDDLAAALPDLSADHLDKLWQQIGVNGWDQAHQQAKDKGQELKGEWKNATGDTYGSQKAATWKPEGWTDDLEDATEQGLQDELTEAQKAVEDKIAQQAVSAEHRQDLEAKAASLEDRQKALEQAQQHRDKKAQELNDAKAHRASLPSDKADSGQPCPHCGGGIVVRPHKEGGYQLEMPADEALSKDELKGRQKAIASADGTIERLKRELHEAEREVTRVQDQIAEAERARGELDELPAQQEGEAPDVEQARERVRTAEARLAAWRTKRKSDRIHQRIQQNQQVIDALAPDGVRAKKLREAVKAFNDQHLKPLCKAAGWHPVALDQDLLPTLRDRPYALLSESEQYRCRVILQIAMALADGSGALVIDGADILDRPSRNGLMKMVATRGLPAIVAMTASKPDEVPDLAAKGKGITVWIDGGEARPVGTPKEAAE